MKILIIGGGIGGLATAGFLEKKGFEVHLVERAPEFKHIGFSMTLFPNGRRLLRELGIDDGVGKAGYELPWFELADAKGHMVF
ncbi:FAD-dependent oxidoreductase [Candidatus Nomurabacteria bacterium]|nr:FAD-dependent oxidoreductase [Candidatus Nomurabacteria bacterium]